MMFVAYRDSLTIYELQYMNCREKAERVNDPDVEYIDVEDFKLVFLFDIFV